MYKGLPRDFTLSRIDSEAMREIVLARARNAETEEECGKILEEYKTRAKKTYELALTYMEDHDSWDDGNALPVPERVYTNNNAKRKKTIDDRLARVEKKLLKKMAKKRLTSLQKIRVCKRIIITLEETK